MEFILKDRKEAGLLLARKLKGLNLDNPIILAIPRGGVVIGYEIAKAIKGELDIITPRKLKDQNDPELAIGAVMPDGSTFLNEQVISAREISSGYMDKEKKIEIAEAIRRMDAYRGGRRYPEIKGRNIVLVDDGIATGATMIAAERWIKKQNPKKVVIAVPVIPTDMLETISAYADSIIYLEASPFFFGIGQFYKEFPQVEDSEVIGMLKKYWNGVS